MLWGAEFMRRVRIHNEDFRPYAARVVDNIRVRTLVSC
jgi:hypothetical protein